jgi:hypothetical protein
MRRFLNLSAIVTLCVGVAMAPATASAQTDASSALFQALSSTLSLGTHREASRLPTVSLDPTGDATVVFAIRGEGDDAQATRAGALSDTLTVLRTVYQSPEAAQVQMLTVLGTFPFKSTKGRAVRESPVLRAVLSAETASQLDWASLTPESVAAAVDTWWLQGAFANTGNEPVDPPREPTPLDIAQAHLDETLTALAAGDVPIARSQFKQFFDVWDDLDAEVSERFPAQYYALDTELDRAEIAILHSQPADLGAAQEALHKLRGYLVEISGLFD